MLRAFKAFSERITGEYEKAFDALSRDDYVEANQILSALAMSHAKTSLSLRNQLVKDGLLKESK